MRGEDIARGSADVVAGVVGVVWGTVGAEVMCIASAGVGVAVGFIGIL